MAPGLAQAQTEAPQEAQAGRRFAVVPTFAATATFTDNVRLTSTNRQADLITQLSPGIQLTSTSGPIRGFLGYALNGLVYAHESQSNEVQHALNAAATIEALENRAYIDVSGNISQQTVSAFGTQSSDNTSANPNRTAVATYSISPYLRGPIGDFANYEARLTYADLGNGNTSDADVATTEVLLRLSGTTSLRSLGWSIDGTRQSYDYAASNTVKSDRVRGLVSYGVTPDLRLSVIAGRESENFETAEKRSHNDTGWAIEWTPTERTRLSATRERRFFGNSHAVSFEHRTPRTVWRFTDSRDLTNGFDQFRRAGAGTAYDLFFTQFASLEPDPLARAVLVNTFLQNNGISPNAVVLGGSLPSAALVQRRQDLSFALLGLRDTLTVIVSQSESERASRSVSVTDDFANGNLLRQRGITVTLAHRLTPLSSLDLTGWVQNTSGTVDARFSKLRTIALSWSARVNPRTSVALTGRHSRFVGSSSDSYHESALVATLGLQF